MERCFSKSIVQLFCITDFLVTIEKIQDTVRRVPHIKDFPVNSNILSSGVPEEDPHILEADGSVFLLSLHFVYSY